MKSYAPVRIGQIRGNKKGVVYLVDGRDNISDSWRVFMLISPYEYYEMFTHYYWSDIYVSADEVIDDECGN